MSDDFPVQALQDGVPQIGFASVSGRGKAPTARPQSPRQLCLPGFRDRPYVGTRTPVRVARWVLRVLARTEARDAYLASRSSPVTGIDRLLGFREDQRPRNSSDLTEVVIRRLEEIDALPDDDGGALRTNIALLAAELGLNEIECEFLEMRSQISLQPALSDLFTELFENRWPDTNLARIMAVAFDREPAEVASALSRSGRLCRTGLVRIKPSSNDNFIGKTGMRYGLSNALLQPAGCLEELLSFAVQTAPAATLTADNFPHLQAELATIASYLRAAARERLAGVNILLHGPPGVGKTELARALPQALGLRSFEVRLHGYRGELLDLEARLDAYRMTQALLGAAGNAAVIFDESENALPCDESLHQQRDSIKAWLNDTLETNPLPALWIANSVERIDPAYVRRFDIVLEIKAPPRSVRRRILEEAFGGLPVRPAWIDQQAADADIAPAVAKRLAKVLQKVGDQAPEQVEAMYERLARGHKDASGRSTHGGYPRIADYHLEWVNVDADLPGLCATLRQRPRGRLLFHGPPGTGKTALAHHLAEAVDRPLLVKRASDLVSKYLGDTEKNLRNMFDDARAEKAVLLLDEADSFLQDRSLAHRSWEVTEVNELLTQMESFDGLFVAATNFLDHLDPAALRRFGLKLAFRPLRPAQAAALFASRYRALAERELTEDEMTAVASAWASLDLLTPGDFAAAAARWDLLGSIPSATEFVDSLRAEQAAKPGGGRLTMGFR